MCPPIRCRSRDQSFARRGAVTIGLASLCLSRVKVSGKIIPYRLHYLLQFCDVIDSIATLTTGVSVFGPPSVGDKSSGMENRHENQGRDSIKVGSSPHKTLCISILDFRRRSIITSGSRVSSDCQYESTTLLLSKVHSQRHGQVR
jgi:hypothetical protein